MQVLRGGNTDSTPPACLPPIHVGHCSWMVHAGGAEVYHEPMSSSQQAGVIPPAGNSEQQARDLHVEFFSRPGYLAIIRQMVDAFSGRLGFAPAEASRICLAVDEALCNVIRHGYDSSPDGRIWLTINEPTDDHCIEFIIEDRAQQVDLDTIRSRNLEDIRPGGLGVHLIGEIMDSVNYEHRDGGGMRLTMRKRIPGEETN